MANELMSLRELFENRIVLRDLDPTDPELPKWSALKDDLYLSSLILPRKNELAYAKVVHRITRALVGKDPSNFFYVGDTVFHDGSVIVNLDKISDRRTIGFICNEKDKVKKKGDFILGPIVFSESWSHLWKLIPEANKRRLDISSNTVCIFDLDQTVYAAKGRNDAALKNARLRAVLDVLKEAIGTHRFVEDRIIQLYRNFDNETYHPITGDNQDYLVFLVLVCSLGMSDPQGILNEFQRKGASILSFIANVRAQLELRRQIEPLHGIWELVQEVYYNTLSGDSAPLKTFRSKEFISTASAMSNVDSINSTDTPNESMDSIYITREVMELIFFLRSHGARVIAFSDRPPEAAFPPAGETGTSLLDIPMQVYGPSIKKMLA